MSDPLVKAQIPAAVLPCTWGLLNNLIGNLRTIEDCLVEDRPVPLRLAMFIEHALLLMLDELSPEIRDAIAKAHRYEEAPKIGGKT